MNSLYDLAREQFLGGALNFVVDPWEVWLVTADYVFDPAHTNFAADVPPAAQPRKALEDLSAKTNLAGYANSGPVTFGRVLSGPRYTGVIFVHGVSGLLLWYGDTGISLPFTPDGSEVILRPDAAQGGWFRL